MFEGTYKFYLDNELVHEQKNALTVAGRSIIIKSLLGIIPNFGNAIAVGIGNNKNNINQSSGLIEDNNLNFEISRTQVNGSTLNVKEDTDLLVYTTTLNSPETFTIYEVGLFPTLDTQTFIGVRGSTIFDFNNVDIFTKIGSASGAYLSTNINARIGKDLFFIPNMNGADSYLRYFASPGQLQYLNTYSSQDVFRLAGYNETSNSASIHFRFFTDSSNYYELIFNPSSSGYFINQQTKGSAIISGNPDWNNISFVDIWGSGSSGGVYLDGMRIDTGSYFIDTTTGMVSRAVLDVPLNKPSSVPLVIEYSLALGFNLE